MADPGLNKLLNWAVRNSAQSTNGEDAPAEGAAPAGRGLDADALRALMGGPSDADRMKDAMTAIQSPQVDLDNKLIAFDNFEQLVEGIDNANNMENLALWVPLVEQLDNTVSELRCMAAWCISTAVQNNIQAQGRALALGIVSKLVTLGLNDEQVATRKKAITALSSEVRNYQPGMDELLKHLPKEHQPSSETVDATDMDAVDVLINKLREEVAKPR
ncbi:hypothetical protein FH972_024873 [Carpinus fangiana]|uniref:Nucleotide exchange factor Fes1 domain-containing protein n=1 Tax=Carpinus fangiana TaxID=176857 RepID=A0A5N6KZR9_9ROSI|nr:hypothetical protein FH972_024873 [Carpinus fangiana]